MSEQKKTTRDAIEATKKKLRFYRRLVLKGLSKWELSRAQRKQLEILRGKGGRMEVPMLSDFKARLKASVILIKLMKRHWNAQSSTRRYFWATFIDDMGNTSDRRPQVNHQAFQRKIDKAIRAIGLEGVIALEVQPLMNYPRKGLGRTLMCNGHAILWTDDEGFDPDVAAKALNSRRSWSNAFGAPPVQITPMTDAPGEIEWLAHYMLKLPHDVKNLMPKHGSPGRGMFMSTTQGYRPELALRIWEWMTQVKLTSAVFGVGSGKVVVREWRKTLLDWHKGRPLFQPLAAAFDVAELWEDLRANNGSDKFEPFRFLSGSERPWPVHLPPRQPL